MASDKKRQTRRRRKNLIRRRRQIIRVGIMTAVLVILLSVGILVGINTLLAGNQRYTPMEVPPYQTSTEETSETYMQDSNETEASVSAEGEIVTEEAETFAESAESISEITETIEETTEMPVISVAYDPIPDPVYVDIVAVGDNLLHRSVSMSGIQPDGSFNYDYNFSKVAHLIQAADIAVINEEAVIGGNHLGILGYPCFNALTEMADAIVRNGFDVVLGATNHTLDQGVGAVHHMISYFQTHYPQIALLGVHPDWETRDQVKVVDCKGIRIAMINYTDLLNIPSQRNGHEYIIDFLEYERLAALIRQAKAISDFVIVFPHWGTEYNLGTDAKQQEQVAFLAQHGVDLVIGTHPHVVEPIDYITRPDGKKMLVYYSLGNYQSIQNKEATVIGGMAKVRICKTYMGVTITDFNMQFLANDFRMTPGFRDYYDRITTYPWEQYSREMAETSWVHHDNPAFNVDLLFQLQAQMQAQVTAERQEAGLE